MKNHPESNLLGSNNHKQDIKLHIFNLNRTFFTINKERPFPDILRQKNLIERFFPEGHGNSINFLQKYVVTTIDNFLVILRNYK